MSRYLLGFDIGGTFTDFILFDAESGKTWIYKCLTTPENSTRGAIKGLNTLLKNAALTMGDLSHSHPRHNFGDQCIY